MKLKITIPLAIATWWIPILSGLILGFSLTFLERDYRKGILSLLGSASIASALYIFLSFFVLKVPLLGNLLPILSIIFSVVDTIIAYLVYSHTFYHVALSKVSDEGIYSEFFASSREEVEEKIKNLLINCKDPVMSLYEDKIVIHRECSGYTIDYEMTEAGKNKYKIKLYVKKKSE